MGASAPRILHICLMLCTLITSAADVPQIPRLSPSLPLPPMPNYDVCNPIDLYDQAFVLVLFFAATGGSTWLVSTGWPSLGEVEEFLHSASIPYNCSLTFGNTTYSGLPVFCCWFGISCCLSEACGAYDEFLATNCNCTVGAVTGISLSNNNLTGSLDGSTFSSPVQSLGNITVLDILTYLSCNLRGLGLQHNALAGGIPDAVTLLSQLQALNLGYNQLTGSLPRRLGYMTAFNVLELTGNRLTGGIPTGICSDDGSSPLTDLFLGGNMFTGTLDVSRCRNLILMDASNNRLDGSIPSISGFPVLHIVQLSGNNFSGHIPSHAGLYVFGGNLVTDLNLANNRMSGTVPATLADLIYLTSLDLQLNYLTGTLPASLFSNLGTLTSMDISNNQVTGSIPSSIGQASALLSLSLSQTMMTGVIPDNIVPILAYPRKYLSVRFSFFSCCGQGFDRRTMRYSWYNYSMPLLPAGLSLSTSMRFVSTVQPVNIQGLSCPYIYRSDTVDIMDNLLIWDVDPQYYLFMNCTCQRGYVFTNLSVHGEPNVTCVLPPESSEQWWANMPYIWGVIALIPTMLFIALTWYCVFRRGSRPVFIQNYINMRKRLQGPPQPGDQMSIVVTDIQGFSDLMRRSPQLTTEALMMHNLLIRKTKWTHFGFTIEQEGDSYSILFHDAVDAVKFCLQSQQSLAEQEWPEGLFQTAAGSSAESEGAQLKSTGTRFLSSLVHRGSRSKRRSLDVSSYDGSKRSDVAASFQSLFRNASGKKQHSAAAAPAAPAARSHVELALNEVEVEVQDPPEDSRGTPSAPPAQQEGPLESPSTAGRSSPAAPVQRKSLFPPGGYGRSRSLPTGHSGNAKLQGLRVRMGIATGILVKGTAAAASLVMENAKVISDAAAGGQVLMCSSTFKAVQHLNEELGCVDHSGLNLSRLNAQKAPWWILGAKSNRERHEAVLLDMGRYVQCSKDVQVPLLLTPRYLSGHGGGGGGRAGLGLLNAGSARPMEQTLGGEENGGNAASATAASSAASAGKEPVQPQLQLYQILASTLVARGRVFGSSLALKDWTPLDVPYFTAPGAMYAPIGPTDVVMAGLDLPPVTVVFCQVEGAKAFASRSRQDAQAVHLALQAVVRSVLRQIPNSYFVKEQDGEMKFLLAFQHPAAALMWCMAVQECAMCADWPLSALRQWPEESAGGRLLFRGPRLKMGVCEGCPRSILPDYLGRADYCGGSINQAARFMDAAAHGGQIACEESLFQRLVSFWTPTEPDLMRSMNTGAAYSAAAAATAETAAVEEAPTLEGEVSRVQSAPNLAVCPTAQAATQEERQQRQQQSNWRGGGWLGVPSVTSTSKSVNGFGQFPLEPLMEQDEGVDAATTNAHGASPLSYLDLAHPRQAGDEGNSATAAAAAAAEAAASGAARSAGQCGGTAVPPAAAAAGAAAAASTPPAAAAGRAARGNPMLGCLSAGAESATAEFSANMVPGAQMDVVAIHLGLFRFKGSPEPISMVSVTPAGLQGRRFPLEPPRGKGARLSEGSGVVAQASVPVLLVIQAYYEAYIKQREALSSIRRSRSLQPSPTSASPTGLLWTRSMNSLRGRSLSLMRRTDHSAVSAPSSEAVAPSSQVASGTTVRDL